MEIMHINGPINVIKCVAQLLASTNIIASVSSSLKISLIE